MAWVGEKRMSVPRDERAFGKRAFQSTRFAAHLLLCLAALGAGALAAQHPIPLEQNTDSAKCIECHANKTKGKHVHSAMAMGCNACHVVTQAKGVTTINLVAPAKELCFSCHAKSTEKVLHGPYAQGNCIVCHSPHASNWPNQLLAPTQDLCMGCHVHARLRVNTKQRTAKVPWGVTLTFDQLKGWQYIGLNKALNANHPVEGHPVRGANTLLGAGSAEINCLSCHQPHHSQNVNLLPAQFTNQTALCLSCHKGEF
jgi:predicted CXXCH cytochrome family protein